MLLTELEYIDCLPVLALNHDFKIITLHLQYIPYTQQSALAFYCIKISVLWVYVCYGWGYVCYWYNLMGSYKYDLFSLLYLTIWVLTSGASLQPSFLVFCDTFTSPTLLPHLLHFFLLFLIHSFTEPRGFSPTLWEVNTYCLFPFFSLILSPWRLIIFFSFLIFLWVQSKHMMCSNFQVHVSVALLFRSRILVP